MGGVATRLEALGHVPGSYCASRIVAVMATDRNQKVAARMRIIKVRSFDIRGRAAAESDGATADFAVCPSGRSIEPSA